MISVQIKSTTQFHCDKSSENVFKPKNKSAIFIYSYWMFVGRSVRIRAILAVVADLSRAKGPLWAHLWLAAHNLFILDVSRAKCPHQSYPSYSCLSEPREGSIVSAHVIGCSLNHCRLWCSSVSRSGDLGIGRSVEYRKSGEVSGFLRQYH